MNDLIFKVEEWTPDDRHVAEVLATSTNVLVGRAAFDAAVKLRPRAIIVYRHGARVIAEHRPVKQIGS